MMKNTTFPGQSSPDTYTIYSGRPSKLLLIPTIIKTLLPALLAVIASFQINWPVVFQRPSLIMVGMWEYGMFLQPILLVLLLPLVALSIFAFQRGVLQWMTASYMVSSDRIEYEEGVFSKRVVNIELWRVRDVYYQRNVIQALLGLGVIEVIINDDNLPQLSIGPIRNSKKVYDDLKQARLQSGRTAGSQATGIYTP